MGKKETRQPLTYHLLLRGHVVRGVERKGGEAKKGGEGYHGQQYVILGYM